MQVLKITGSLAVFVALTALISVSNAQPLKRYTWKNRPLIIFSPSQTSPELERQRLIIQDDIVGFRDRDMVVLEIVGETVQNRLGVRANASAAAFRQYYKVNRQQFRVFLIGKDGGIKLRSASAIRANRLFNLIDAMPMRKNEMRNR